jgi:DNA processing protein
MSLPTLVELTSLHPDYPIGVRAMARPPDRLFVRGTIGARRSIGIVGTRGATREALLFTRQLAAGLAEQGVAVWSGGAEGIDTAAHEGALEAGGRTVVVMGTGFAHPYPSGNRRLFERVLEEGGAWLSPFAEDQRGGRWTFLLRNELLASLVGEVVIVQAPLRSGARSTAAAARRMNKVVWAVPAAPWDLRGAGCLAELRAGARALSDPLQLGVRRRGNEAHRDLSREERAVIKAIGSGAERPDAICEKTGLSAGPIAAALMTLTLRHMLLESSDGLFHLVKF